MKLKNLKNNKGFTIIEVLIVLAIAGLIMLVVFLAVPALQRNSRNTQRTNDASLIAAAVNECLANRNGQTASCDQIITVGATTQEIPLEVTKLSQLTDYTPAGSGTASATAPGGPLYGTTVGNTNQFTVAYASECNQSGDAVQAGSRRQFVVVYRYETAASDAIRCLGS